MTKTGLYLAQGDFNRLMKPDFSLNEAYKAAGLPINVIKTMPVTGQNACELFWSWLLEHWDDEKYNSNQNSEKIVENAIASKTANAWIFGDVVARLTRLEYKVYDSKVKLCRGCMEHKLTALETGLCESCKK